jgi:hypothetical protein
MGDPVEFACWSKTEDREIDEAYRGEEEIASGDRMYSASVSEASNISEVDETVEAKPYTDEDRSSAEELF